MIILNHFRGIKGRGTPASIDCRGTLLNQLHKAHHFTLICFSRSFSITEIIKDEKLEIPEIAFKEVLLNLLIHRNYHIKAPSTLYDDRSELFLVLRTF